MAGLAAVVEVQCRGLGVGRAGRCLGSRGRVAEGMLDRDDGEDKRGICWMKLEEGLLAQRKNLLPMMMRIDLVKEKEEEEQLLVVEVGEVEQDFLELVHVSDSVKLVDLLWELG